MNPNELTPEARKILKRWARQDMYVYMRPMSGVYAGGDDPSKIFWSVSVEYRAMVDHQQIRGEGWNISKVIVEMSGRVPNRDREQPGYVPGKNVGWLAAQAVAEQQKADMRKARKKAERKKAKVEEERPRKRKKAKA